jgi:DMSO/TMAO reductase YedYZ molybdopterin-dependent catalytic subunit
MAKLHVEGAIEHPLALGMDDLRALPDQVDDVSTLLAGRRGGGVRLGAILDAARPHPDARTLTLLATDAGFAADAPLAAARDGVVVYRLGDEPLPDELGGPLRFLLVAPAGCEPDGGLTACANVKQLDVIRVLTPSP